MVGMKIMRCSDKLLGSGLCTNQAAFALTLMFLMDITLFFLDTFLWYVIWNTVFSITRSFALGLSIWTPWVVRCHHRLLLVRETSGSLHDEDYANAQDIFQRLPRRIYAKLLVADMEIKYKPKVLVSQVWNAIVISMCMRALRLLFNSRVAEKVKK